MGNNNAKEVKGGVGGTDVAANIEFGLESTFSLGPQLGVKASVANFGGGVWAQGPSLERKVKPYLRYSKETGWSVGIDSKVYNVRKASGVKLPLYENNYRYHHGIYEHSCFTKVNMNTTRGFEQVRIDYSLDPTLSPYSEQEWFNAGTGVMIRPGIFGAGVSFGIEGLIN